MGQTKHEGSLRGMRVLVVEDDPAVREVLARLLGGYGMVTFEAGSVAEALTLYDEERPDFVLSDINLPDATGFELVWELRARGETAPAVAVSADTIDESAASACGFSAWLAKPVGAAELAATLGRLGGGREAA